MVPPDGVEALLGRDGVVARRLGDYEERPQQIALAGEIEAALRERRHLLAEAGTGVGKSFAYLVPAILHALRARGEGPVVVSTRTIALQHQLEHKDIPFLQAVLPHEFTAVTAVGRNHYVCLRRLDLARREERALFDDPALSEDLELVSRWALTARNGTRQELPRPVADRVWEEVQAERGNCLHKACPHYGPCPYQRARRRMGSAQILIVNHALYLADVALRMAGARYLPAHRVAVFDEAHHLERVAREHLGLRLSGGTVRWHLNRLQPRRGVHGLLQRFGSDRARRLFTIVEAAADEFFARLDDRLRANGTAQVALGDEVLADPLSEPLAELAAELGACAAAIQELSLRTEMLARVQGLDAVCVVVRALCRGGDANTVRWIEGTRRGAELHSAPIEVGPALRDHLFGALGSAVLVSATLAPGDDGDFAWLRERLGIGEARTLRVGSPFRYERQCELVVEDGLPDPVREPAAFTAAATTRAVDYVLDNGGRALVLCTSWQAVHQVAAALRAPLAAAGIRLLVQGDAPTAQLVRDKNADPTSVLVGTDTLWEGIDVPGEALTLVVVTRLPFAQPDHPLTRARHQAITARGGDPFVEDSLPEAILRFRQGFGRLIRSARDRGRVVVLDPRVRTRRYGRRFLASLPFAPGGDADGEQRDGLRVSAR
ncbi:MAG TPA: helicase C-terminal domain-containing protein [Planctomycetota bacterium]|nr:helicase C-terminal domain-containing protein [Planctomycetota bacterium]